MVKPGNHEERERVLDPHREEEQHRARQEAEDRLRDRNVQVTGHDTDEGIADLLDAVERFEATVESLGGDLFVNRIGVTEPQDPAFVLPTRASGEGAAEYRSRIEAATRQLRHRHRG